MMRIELQRPQVCTFRKLSHSEFSVYVSGQPSEAHVMTKYAKRLSVGNINN